MADKVEKPEKVEKAEKPPAAEKAEKPVQPSTKDGALPPPTRPPPPPAGPPPPPTGPPPPAGPPPKERKHKSRATTAGEVTANHLQFTLGELVDLALCSPEVGAVNFNILRLLLGDLVEKIGVDKRHVKLSDLEAHQVDNFRNYVQGSVIASPMPGVLRIAPTGAPRGHTHTQNQGASGGLPPSGQKDGQTVVISSPKAKVGAEGATRPAGGGGGRKTVSPDAEDIHDRVDRLEKHLAALYELPTNNELIEKAKAGEGNMSVNDMWQIIQLNNRIAAAEAAIQKMASLIEDLAKNMSKVKTDTKHLKEETKNLSKSAMNLRQSREDLCGKCDVFENMVTELRTELDEMKTGWKADRDNLETTLGVELGKVPSFMKPKQKPERLERKSKAKMTPDDKASHEHGTQTFAPNKKTAQKKPEEKISPEDIAQMDQEEMMKRLTFEEVTNIPTTVFKNLTPEQKKAIVDIRKAGRAEQDASKKPMGVAKMTPEQVSQLDPNLIASDMSYQEAVSLGQEVSDMMTDEQKAAVKKVINKGPPQKPTSRRDLSKPKPQPSKPSMGVAKMNKDQIKKLPAEKIAKEMPYEEASALTEEDLDNLSEEQRAEVKKVIKAGPVKSQAPLKQLGVAKMNKDQIKKLPAEKIAKEMPYEEASALTQEVLDDMSEEQQAAVKKVIKAGPVKSQAPLKQLGVAKMNKDQIKKLPAEKIAKEMPYEEASSLTEEDLDNLSEEQRAEVKKVIKAGPVKSQAPLKQLGVAKMNKDQIKKLPAEKIAKEMPYEEASSLTEEDLDNLSEEQRAEVKKVIKAGPVKSQAPLKQLGVAKMTKDQIKKLPAEKIAAMPYEEASTLTQEVLDDMSEEQQAAVKKVIKAGPPRTQAPLKQLGVAKMNKDQIKKLPAEKIAKEMPYEEASALTEEDLDNLSEEQRAEVKKVIKAGPVKSQAPLKQLGVAKMTKDQIKKLPAEKIAAMPYEEASALPQEVLDTMSEEQRAEVKKVIKAGPKKSQAALKKLAVAKMTKDQIKELPAEKIGNEMSFYEASALPQEVLDTMSEEQRAEVKKVIKAGPKKSQAALKQSRVAKMTKDQNKELPKVAIKRVIAKGPKGVQSPKKIIGVSEMQSDEIKALDPVEIMKDMSYSEASSVSPEVLDKMSADQKKAIQMILDQGPGEETEESEQEDDYDVDEDSRKLKGSSSKGSRKGPRKGPRKKRLTMEEVEEIAELLQEVAPEEIGTYITKSTAEALPDEEIKRRFTKEQAQEIERIRNQVIRLSPEEVVEALTREQILTMTTDDLKQFTPKQREAIRAARRALRAQQEEETDDEDGTQVVRLKSKKFQKDTRKSHRQRPTLRHGDHHKVDVIQGAIPTQDEGLPPMSLESCMDSLPADKAAELAAELATETLQKELQKQYQQLQGAQRQLAIDIQTKMEFIYQKLLREIATQQPTTSPYMSVGGPELNLGPGICTGKGMPAGIAVVQFPDVRENAEQALVPAGEVPDRSVCPGPGVCPGSDVCPYCKTGACQSRGVDESFIREMKQELDKLRDEMRSKPEGGGRLSLVKRTSNEREDIQILFNNLANVIAECSDLRDKIEQMSDAANLLETSMVSKQLLEEILTNKADTSLIATKVSYDEFGNTIDELHTQLHNLMVEGYQRNENWKKVTSDMAGELSVKLDKVALGPLRAFFKTHLKALEEKVQTLTALIEEPDPAGTRKKILRDYNCISCDRNVNITGMTNVPTLPMIGPIPAGHSTASRRALEVHRMRMMNKFDPNTKSLTAMERQCCNMKIYSCPASNANDDVMNMVNRYTGGSHTTVDNSTLIRAKRGSKASEPVVKILPNNNAKKSFSKVPSGTESGLAKEAVSATAEEVASKTASQAQAASPAASKAASPAASQPPPMTSSPAGSKAASPAASQPPPMTSSPAGSKAASPAASQPPPMTSSPAGSKAASPAASQPPPMTSSPAGSKAASPAASQPPPMTSSPAGSKAASPAASQPPPMTSSPAGSKAASPAASKAASPAASQPPPKTSSVKSGAASPAESKGSQFQL